MPSGRQPGAGMARKPIGPSNWAASTGVVRVEATFPGVGSLARWSTRFLRYAEHRLMPSFFLKRLAAKKVFSA